MTDGADRTRGAITANTLMPFLVMGVLFILLFPLPPLLMDLFLVLNISLSMLILLMMFYLVRPMDLNVFPSLLLVMTLFRLSLNVASTKLILLQGNAGRVIDAFGKFVVGN
ncbi:MAG: EscV/YscV/HrcV family type III secretion system export apparatus protein, partial [Lentisphaerae bacterium]